MASGDVRATEMPGLASMHTLMFREHNRVAELIKPELEKRNQLPQNETEADELIYQLARRITIAEWQSVVYGEYLPVVLGERITNDSSFGLQLLATGSTYNPG